MMAEPEKRPRAVRDYKRMNETGLDQTIDFSPLGSPQKVEKVPECPEAVSGAFTSGEADSVGDERFEAERARLSAKLKKLRQEQELQRLRQEIETAESDLCGKKVTKSSEKPADKGNPLEVRNENAACLEEKEQEQEKSQAEYNFMMVRDSYTDKFEISTDVICTFIDKEVSEIEEVNNFVNVLVDTELGKITVSGPPHLVTEAVAKIERKIDHIKRQRKLADLDKKPGVVVTWSYDLDDTGAESHAYEETTNAAIEEAYRKLQDDITITDLDTKTSFVVDFVDMIEYMKDNENDYVKVYRNVTSEDDSVKDKDEMKDTSSSNSQSNPRLPGEEKVTLKRKAIRSLNAEQVTDLEQIHSAAVIKVVQSENKITISGRPRVTKEANIRVDRYLRHVERERELKQEASYTRHVIKWSYDAVDSISGKLVPVEFTEDINQAIENEYIHMQDEMSLFDKENQAYLIADFIDMVVYGEADRSCYNGLRRAIYAWINT